ncbi:hypothetical protein NFI96_018772, partial [Prochilodus magdalenae]
MEGRQLSTLNSDGLLRVQMDSHLIKCSYPLCYFTALRPAPDELYQHVGRLWQLDVLPLQSEKLAVRSKQDQQAVDMVESGTTRENVRDVLRLLRRWGCLWYNEEGLVSSMMLRPDLISSLSL